MIKTKREMIKDIWKTNPFAIAWKKKLNRNKEIIEPKITTINKEQADLQIANYKRIIEEVKKCEFCNGIGEVSVLGSVYPGTPDWHIQAYVDSTVCNNCNGTGLEEDSELVKSRLVDNLTKEQEDKLKEEHSKSYTGTDDDMPDKFEDWLIELSLEDLLKII